jgi:hypothetical protein
LERESLRSQSDAALSKSRIWGVGGSRASDAAIAKLGQKNDTRTMWAYFRLIAMTQEKYHSGEHNVLDAMATIQDYRIIQRRCQSRVMVIFWPTKINKTKEAIMKTYIPAHIYFYDYKSLFVRVSVTIAVSVIVYSTLFGITL